MRAKRNKQIGGYDYKGYYFCKEEGCTYWNIYKYENTIYGLLPNFTFPETYADSFNQCKQIIDDLVINMKGVNYAKESI